jgi:ABC-type transport system involved in cytochrome c biogenesis permease subunit
MESFFQHVTRFCFGASYAVALALELVQLLRPNSWARWIGLAFGSAGLLAHTLYLLFQQPQVATPSGSLLLLAWVVAVFYLYGALHHYRQAWALFVLPIVLILVLLSGIYPAAAEESSRWFTGENFWGAVHGSLLLLAAIGVSVACVASVMYLVQTFRLKAKATPGKGLRLPSLERLAQMNRRAIVWAFPMLTAGLLLGVVLLAQRPEQAWTAPKVLGTGGLWLAFLVLIYLRYFAHSSNRRLAVLTIAAFGLMVVTLAASHPVAAGGRP